MIIWQAKSSTDGTYVTMKSPSSYKIDWEDLDADSYRSITTGNLIDTVISKKWAKIGFEYNCLSANEKNAITTMINNNPIYVIAKEGTFVGDQLEAQFRCSKASAEMLETGDYKLSFNLVQKKKVAGQ